MHVKGGFNGGRPYLGCPLCGEPCEVRLTKTDLPYWQCKGCMVQVFVRSKGGAKTVKRILKEASEHG